MCNAEAAWLLGTLGSFFLVNISSSSVNFVSYLELSLWDLDMVNFTHGWTVGGSGHIVHTQDGWQTFEDQSYGQSKSFRDVFFWDYNKGWVIGTGATILATSNGGKTWRVQYSPPFSLSSYWGSNAITDIVFITEHKGWTVGSGIHATEDGGKCWMNFGSKTPGPLKIAFANETHGWAVSSRKDRSYITTTGGFHPLSETTINFGVFLITIFGMLLFILLLRVISSPKFNSMMKWKWQ